MIQSFADRDTRALFEDDACHRQWRAFKKAALRKLDMLDAAVELGDLASPPGNRLEALRGDRAGQYSIRINAQWRIRFLWGGQGPEKVEIPTTIDGALSWPAFAPTRARS
jgi:toxin HigB-1